MCSGQHQESWFDAVTTVNNTMTCRLHSDSASSHKVLIKFFWCVLYSLDSIMCSALGSPVLLLDKTCFIVLFLFLGRWTWSCSVVSNWFWVWQSLCSVSWVLAHLHVPPVHLTSLVSVPATCFLCVRVSAAVIKYWDQSNLGKKEFI